MSVGISHISRQRDLHQVRVERAALYETLPPRAIEMPEGYIDGRGIEHQPHRGWTTEKHEQVDALIAREREFALAVGGRVVPAHAASAQKEAIPGWKTA